MRWHCLLSATLIAFLPTLAPAQGKEKPKWAPSPHIAATEPLRPEAQLKKMKVPPGFEIQLVAADPDIRKPINIAFDAAGRLWVTETIEYPFPAKPGQERDAVKILEDFGPDGRARKITTFVDKLNIPIGVIPDTDGKGALVYSIPSIKHMRDTKGTGKADVREVYYSSFGVDDTHGMTGEFMRGFDGWIYACHGFRNKSTVKCKDGSTSISMESGNTYRIRPNGSRIEKYTTGQVNPFGIGIDPNGNLYTGDCHSRPLTMLIRGAMYESFARPHDGLGFAPHMNTFQNHSTALCGVTYYAANQFPSAYRDKLFLGDVVLNRVNAYKLQWTGATPAAIMEDFITSQDPWFRPVDIKLGPDGCLYIADFYNRVIGHYELPLDHPARDREKGRIWRVVYRGKPGDATGFTGKFHPHPVTNLVTADAARLVDMLGHTNLAVRLHAADQLVERIGKDAIPPLLPIVKDIGKPGDGARKAHALWVLERLGKLDDDTLTAAAQADEPAVRVHVQRILAEKKIWNKNHQEAWIKGITNRDPHVKLAALEAAAASPAKLMVSLLALHHDIDPRDARMLYAARLALREQLRLDGNQGDFIILFGKMPEKDHRALVDVSLGLRDEFSAFVMQTYFLRFDESIERSRVMIHHVVRHGDAGATNWALDHLAKKHAREPNAQGQLLKAILQANQERGRALTTAERGKSEPIVIGLLDGKATADKQLGAELAGTLKLTKVQPQLFGLIQKQDTPESLRKACVAAVVNLDAKKAIAPLSELLLNEKEAIAIREQVANALAATNSAEAHAALVKALQDSPARLQTTIALGMAGSPQGGDRLLAAIEAGKASPRLLQDRAIELRLASAKIPNVKMRLKAQMKDLPPADQKTQELIARKRDSFTSFKGDAEIGQKVFQKSCANCHQINTKGAKIGPQLDGIGVRGLERLLEDVLDPNRNVDQAFRTTQIITKKGLSLTGLFLREEGKVVILGDKEGKEIRIDKADVDERNVIPLSPMPSNFLETISAPDFHHLLAYLLAQRGKS